MVHPRERITPDSWTLPTSLILDEFPVTGENHGKSHGIPSLFRCKIYSPTWVHCYIFRKILSRSRREIGAADMSVSMSTQGIQRYSITGEISSPHLWRKKSKSAGLSWAQKKPSTIHRGVRFHGDCFPSSWMSIRCTRSIPCTINLDKPSNPGGNAVNANPRFRGIFQQLSTSSHIVLRPNSLFTRVKLPEV